jgi:2-oxoglutarate ferredoxin oxidoreductase subunit beta
MDFNKTLFVSGIGCAAWIPSPHFNSDTLHTLHGRAIATATGAKLSNPALNTIVISGDGDLLDIGGNHLIHAARRNIDLTVICANNYIYGMTGGQVGSTTPYGAMTTTTSEGSPYHPINACRLVAAAGARYTARYSVTQPYLLIRSIKNALKVNGFSFVEVLSPCYSQYGRRNEFRNAAELLKFQKKMCVNQKIVDFLCESKVEGKIITGEYYYGGN